MRKIVSVLLFAILFCRVGYAAERKISAALIDFNDATPNKMMISPGEYTEDKALHLPEVMRVVRELTEKSGLFELLPQKSVADTMLTATGREAAARRFDRFSAVRLGKLLGVDAILTGEIVQFEKNIIPRNFTISGIDISNRAGDVIIRARIVNAYTGAVIAEATGDGTADENMLESVSAAAVNKLSIGFVQATKDSVSKILSEFSALSADIKIDKEYIPPQKTAETDFTVLKAEGQFIHINAGLIKGVSIADLFTILKKDDAGNLNPAAVYRVTAVEPESSRLVLVEPKEIAGMIRPGDKARRKTGSK